MIDLTPFCPWRYAQRTTLNTFLLRERNADVGLPTMKRMGRQSPRGLAALRRQARPGLYLGLGLAGAPSRLFYLKQELVAQIFG